MIAEEGLERIDLLKINVEKSEWDVLQGISAGDWPRIRQLVIEVDQKQNLEPITTLLEQNGHEVLVEQRSTAEKNRIVLRLRHSAVREQPPFAAGIRRRARPIPTAACGRSSA